MYLAVIFIFVSCNKEEKQVDDYKHEFEQASLMHNEAMDIVLSNLKDTEPASNEQIIKTIKLSTKEYVENNQMFFYDLNVSQKLLNSETDRLIMFDNKKRKSKLFANSTDFLLNTINNFSDNLSLAQKELLLEIHNIFESESLPMNIISKLNVIKDIKCLELPVEERPVIYAATTIGIQSVEYWHENLDEWIYTITNQKVGKDVYKAKGWFDWGSLGKSDIAGAVGGAIGGAMAGAAAGGVGAVPGALIGGLSGGVGTSATDAALQVLNHYF